MLRNAGKPDLINTRAVRVCPKAMVVSAEMYKKPYIYGILRNTGHGMDFSWLLKVNILKLLLF